MPDANNTSNSESINSYNERSGVMSKQEWHDHVDKEVISAQSTGEILSVIFIDIDFLKDINDTFGHDEGDNVINLLHSAVTLLKENFRTNEKPGEDRPLDFVSVDTPQPVPEVEVNVNGKSIKITPGRIGGDEFAALCHTDESGVQVIIKRLRELFGSSVSDELKAMGIDISVGASTLKPGMTKSQFLRLADERLNVDKEAHLPTRNSEEVMILRSIVKQLKAMHIRPRHLGKYAEVYAKDIVNN